jgi:hypothetical protein
MCVLLDDNLTSLKFLNTWHAQIILKVNTLFFSPVYAVLPLQGNQPIAGGSAIISVVHIPLLKYKSSASADNTVLQLISSGCFQANPPRPPRLPAPPSGVSTPPGSLRAHYTLPTYSMPYLASHRLPQSACHLEPMITLYMAPQIFLRRFFYVWI